ncbi:MAG: osmotically inducible protein OsmC [Sulfuricurvum sp. PC08-66]|nr:MAG: osmotically inducible protein OsmC [Sulfuricurvum sp. PC08-66]
MKVTLTHLDAMRFEAATATQSFIIDAPVISPIEIFLSGIIGCTATDMVQLPKNAGFEVRNLRIEGEAVRNETMPRKFNELHLLYSFDSDAPDAKAAQWVMGSIETYCSTLNTIRDTTKISYTIVHNGQTIKTNVPIISGQGGGVDLGTIDACGV